MAGGDLELLAGGKGANQAVAAARLGADVAFCGRVGMDAFGPVMLDGLKSESVDTSLIREDAEAATGTALILVFDSGENMIVISPGANGRVGPDDLTPLESRMGEFDFLLLQFEIPMETVEAAAAMARKAGTRVFLDTAPARNVPDSLLRNVDIVSPNETEAEAILGHPVSDEKTAAEAAKELISRGAGEAIVKLGARGSVWAHPDGIETFQAFAVDAVDPTAAGDAYSAAIAVSLATGMSRAESAAIASAAGALTATKMGAQPSLPSHAEIKTFLETVQ